MVLFLLLIQNTTFVVIKINKYRKINDQTLLRFNDQFPYSYTTPPLQLSKTPIIVLLLNLFLLTILASILFQVNLRTNSSRSIKYPIRIWSLDAVYTLLWGNLTSLQYSRRRTGAVPLRSCKPSFISLVKIYRFLHRGLGRFLLRFLMDYFWHLVSPGYKTEMKSLDRGSCFSAHALVSLGYLMFRKCQLISSSLLKQSIIFPLWQFGTTHHIWPAHFLSSDPYLCSAAWMMTASLIPIGSVLISQMALAFFCCFKWWLPPSMLVIKSQGNSFCTTWCYIYIKPPRATTWCILHTGACRHNSEPPDT